VKSIAATTNTVKVVIANVGTAPVVNSFWVDAYINPSSAPTHVNQIWNTLSTQGLAWAVTTSPTNTLQVGGVITLTIGGAYYSAINSHLNGPLPIGTKIYAQVDSASAGSSYGAVLETHEMSGGAYNNISGPVTSTLVVAQVSTPALSVERWLSEVLDLIGGGLPPR